MFDFARENSARLPSGMLCVEIDSAFKDNPYVIKKILKDIFYNHSLIFRATGFPDNIFEISNDFQSENLRLYMGDSKKFFIRKFPELHVIIQNEKDLDTALNTWTSTIYEKRYLYVVKPGYQHITQTTLANNVYEDSNFLSLLSPFIDCLIENSPESSHPNTFALTFNSEFKSKINHFISNCY